ncbi:MAG: STAS domain-containing protein [Betaproteobacteria bacterium]
MNEGIASLEEGGGRWALSGPLVMDTVALVLGASATRPLPETGVIDMTNVQRVDSAAVALMLAWKRRAAGEAKPLTFASVPANITSLAALYGVAELLET